MAADFYSVLGVSKSATVEEIRKAYKKLSRDNHPDRKPGDAAASEKFKQVQEAWDVLGDAEKRQQYDQYGTTFGPNGPQFRGGPRSGQAGAGPIDLGDLFGGGQVDLGDIFGNMFGGGGAQSPFGRQAGKRSRASNGEDISAEIEIPFAVAAEGGSG